MNTSTAAHLTRFTAAAALLSAALLLPGTPVRAADVQPPALAIVQLPRVTIVGQRLRTAPVVAVAVVQLPRVVITGRRAERASTDLAQTTRIDKPLARVAFKQGA